MNVVDECGSRQEVGDFAPGRKKKISPRHDGRFAEGAAGRRKEPIFPMLDSPGNGPVISLQIRKKRGPEQSALDGNIKALKEVSP